VYQMISIIISANRSSRVGRPTRRPVGNHVTRGWEKLFTLLERTFLARKGRACAIQQWTRELDRQWYPSACVTLTARARQRACRLWVARRAEPAAHWNFQQNLRDGGGERAPLPVPSRTNVECRGKLKKTPCHFHPSPHKIGMAKGSRTLGVVLFRVCGEIKRSPNILIPLLCRTSRAKCVLLPRQTRF